VRGITRSRPPGRRLSVRRIALAGAERYAVRRRWRLRHPQIPLDAPATDPQRDRDLRDGEAPGVGQDRKRRRGLSAAPSAAASCGRCPGGSRRPPRSPWPCGPAATDRALARAPAGAPATFSSHIGRPARSSWHRRQASARSATFPDGRSDAATGSGLPPRGAPRPRHGTEAPRAKQRLNPLPERGPPPARRGHGVPAAATRAATRAPNPGATRTRRGAHRPRPSRCTLGMFRNGRFVSAPPDKTFACFMPFSSDHCPNVGEKNW
jgi:hypothetical protein